ncbi:MAG: LysR family transcriptional regulator [Ruminococcaceae bacterium]|nr:LysR family transcriptional regulator [Oscillospiraceae bacterium]
MNLLQLRYFYESAQTENFSKIAEKFMIPTSTVSAAIKRLETELGVSLFDRETNRIKLNAEGRLLADALGSAFSEVEKALDKIKTDKIKTPEIKLLVRARRGWITDLMVEYKTAHPEVNFRMSHDFEIEDYTDFDIIIDELSDMYDGFEHFLLSAEELCIKASNSSPLVGKKLTMKQISSEPFIMMGKGNAMRRLLESIGKHKGFVPNVAMELDDRQCLLRCVELGMGLAVGSKRALCDESEKELTALDVSDFNETQIVCVYHRLAATDDDYISDFLKFLSSKSKSYFAFS